MRRCRQQLPDPEVKRILAAATHGVLSLTDIDGEPYGVPLSFAYDGTHAIYFHCARCGRKIECIRGDVRASFCIVSCDEIRPEEFTTYFRSVVLAGRISIVEDREETIRGLRMLSDKYSPGIDCETEIARCLNRVAVLRFDIAAMSGKEAIELVRKRLEE